VQRALKKLGNGGPPVIDLREPAAGWIGPTGHRSADVNALARGAGLLSLACIGCTTAFAQLPQPVLNHLFPPGASAGSTNDITVAAADLEEPGSLVFSDPRVIGKPKPGAAGVYQVIVPADVPPGVIDLRVTGRFGVSNPRGFLVESTPTLIQPATNTTAQTAAVLARGTAVWSRLAAASRAVYSFDARKGERVLMRVQTTEVDSRLVPDLAVFDSTGREMARTRRVGGVDFVAGTDGPHRLELTDSQYRGGDDYHYRLERMTGPQVDFALPLGVRAGVTNRVVLFGRQLPGGKLTSFTGADGVRLERVEVDVVAPATLPTLPVARLRRPASAGLPAWDWSWSATNGVSNPVTFLLGDLPVVAAGTDGTAPSVVSVVPPLDFSGVFPRSGELAGVTFVAKKGDVWFMEIVGDRLGQGMDPLVSIQRERSTRDAAGRVQYSEVSDLGELDSNPPGNELPISSRDAAGKFEAPEDGTYRVLVRDVFNVSPSSPRRPYRLTIRRGAPDFRLVTWAQPPPRSNGEDRRLHLTTPTLRRGGTLPLRVVVSRVDGFDGPVELVAEGLPAGVVCRPTLIAGGTSIGTVLLTASEEIAAGQFAVRVVGRAKVGTNQVEHVARGGGPQWTVADFNQEPVVARLSQEFRVGLVPEPEPVVIAAAEDRVHEVKAGAKLSVPLKIGRRHEFTAAFNVKPAGHPALDKTKEFSVAEKATNAVFELNLAEAALSEGEHVVWLQGQAAGKYRNQPEAIAVADAELKAADSALKSASAEQKPTLEKRRKDAEAARKAAEERAKPRDATVGVWSAPIRVRVLPAK